VLGFELGLEQVADLDQAARLAPDFSFADAADRLPRPEELAPEVGQLSRV
jgi:hypothetical protein